MPRLPGGYTAKLDGGTVSGGRRASAEDFGSGDLGAGARAISSAAEKFLDRTEEDESRRVLISQAEIRAKYAKRLDEAATNGEDLGKLREGLDADLAGVTANLTTKKGLETAQYSSANVGSMFDNQANNILVERARINAKLDGNKFLNSEAQILTTNPLYLPQAEKNIDDFMLTYKGRVSPEHRAAMADELKKRANYFAVQSSIKQSANPNDVKVQIEAGKWNLSPEAIEHSMERIESEIRGRQADAVRLRVDQEHRERQKVELAEAKHLDLIVSGKSSWPQIRDDPDLAGPYGTNTKKSLLMMMEARNKAMAAGGERESNKATKMSLWLDISNGKTQTPDKVIEAVTKGLLNTRDADYLIGKIQGNKDENGRTFSARLGARMETIRSAIRDNYEYKARPELGNAVLLEVIARAEQKASELRKRNDGSLDDMLDASSKDYFFKPDLLKAVAADVKAQQQALLPQLPKINTKAEADALPPGTSYIGPDGVVGVVPPGAGKKAAAPVSDFDAWMAATGGALKPGQNQAQAIAEWKARK